MDFAKLCKSILLLLSMYVYKNKLLKLQSWMNFEVLSVCQYKCDFIASSIYGERIIGRRGVFSGAGGVDDVNAAPLWPTSTICTRQTSICTFHRYSTT